MVRFITVLKHFGGDDSGAVTIDWVTLSSLSLLLGIMVVYAIFNHGVSSLMVDVNAIPSTLLAIDSGPVPQIDTGG